MTYLFVIGDSIAYGAWDFEKGGWVQRLREYLDAKVEKDNNKFFITYNLGIDGHTTRDWVSILKSELETRMCIARKYKEPAIVLLALGANDSLFVVDENKNNVSQKEFKENMKTILTISKVFTNQVLCVGIPPCKDKKAVNYDDKNLVLNNENIAKYNTMLRSFTKENNIPFIDIFDAVQKKKNFISFDRVHLSPEGHEIIFRLVKECLMKKKLV